MEAGQASPTSRETGSGFDTWYVRDPFVPEMSVGAPPTTWDRRGQDWVRLPEGLETELEGRGVLSLRVLLFERDGTGAFRRPEQYSPRALVWAGTHDVPALAALWTGRDLQQRHELG